MKVKLLEINPSNNGVLVLGIKTENGILIHSALPITLEVENDNTLGEGREIQRREIPEVHSESEIN